MNVRLAALGADRLGQAQASAIASVPGASLVAVADPVAEERRWWRKNTVAISALFDQIEGASDVDAVVICTPTDTHVDLPD